jgi:uncharacterized RmlC-like cupin family protein
MTIEANYSAVRVVRPHERNAATAQTPGMIREAGIAPETADARAIWMGFVSTPVGSCGGAHHHGDCESTIYVLRGRCRFSYGENLSQTVEVGAGDFLYVPPSAIHAEDNIGEEPLEFIVARNCSTMMVVNVDDPREAAH